MQNGRDKPNKIMLNGRLSMTIRTKTITVGGLGYGLDSVKIKVAETTMIA